MKYLKDSGYSSLNLSKVVALLEGREVLPTKTVVLTFDDGFRNFYSEAFEVLNEYNFTATVFLVTDHCGKRNDWAGNPPELPRSKLLSWPEIRELAGQGIEFGSHTKSHPDLTRLSTDDVENEIVTAKAVIADALGREVTTFAYPFGRINSVVRRIVKDNHRAACSTNLGKIDLGSDLAALNRIDSYYLTNQRIFRRLSTAAFDSYLSFRQAGRGLKALLAGN